MTDQLITGERTRIADLDLAAARGDDARPRSMPHTKLEDALCTVVSAVHAAQLHATAIGFTAMPQFTSEDIRTMANTLIIDGQRAERSNAA